MFVKTNFTNGIILISAVVALSFANVSGAIAQDSEVLEATSIKGWDVRHLKTPSSGISCQAKKCQGRDCSKAGQKWEILLWGSERRSATTPMFSAQFTARGADNAYLDVGGNRYPMERAGTNNRRLIAVNQKHDALILAALVDNQGNKITLGADQGKVTFRLKNMNQVLGYFEEKCSIK